MPKRYDSDCPDRYCKKSNFGVDSDNSCGPGIPFDYQGFGWITANLRCGVELQYRRIFV